MHHFEYRGRRPARRGRRPARRSPREVGTPFYCYSRATLTRHYKCFRRAFAGLRRARLLRHEGEFQPGRAARRWRGSARAWTSSPKANCGARSRQACPASGSHFRASARPRAKSTWRSSGHLLLQRRIRARARGDLADRRRSAARPRVSRCASTLTSMRARMPRSRPASRRTSSASRFRAPAKSMRAAARLPGIHVSGVDMHIGFADHRPAAVRRRLRRCSPNSSAQLRADGHDDRASRSRRRARHSLSRRRGSRLATIPSATPRSCAATPAARLQAGVRAGPADRRQRRHSRHRA